MIVGTNFAKQNSCAIRYHKPRQSQSVSVSCGTIFLMKTLVVGILSLVLLVAFVLPSFAFAAGIVPCTGVNVVKDADGNIVSSEGNCGTCELVVLANNGIEWLIMALLLFMVLLFAIAGFKLATSGGDVGAYNAARGMFQNVLVGLIIVLCSWLLVDTALKILLENSAGEAGYTRFGPWNEIPDSVCTGQIALGTGPQTDFYDTWAELRNISLENEERAQINAASYGVCNEGFLGAYFPGQASVAQCVLSGESACGAYHESTTDLDRNNIPFSVSPWQINLTVHTIQDCDMVLGEGVVLDCPSAYRGRNYSSTIVNTALYEQCSRALTDPVCATVNAQRIYREAGNSWGPWSAYTRNNCG